MFVERSECPDESKLDTEKPNLAVFSVGERDRVGWRPGSYYIGHILYITT
jgi:hypothetical protein